MEYEGKLLLQRYGIAVPDGVLVDRGVVPAARRYPAVMKAQVRSGGRGRAGGVQVAQDVASFLPAFARCVEADIAGMRAERVLIEDFVSAEREYYVSASYDTRTRGPVLAMSVSGGVAIEAATIVPITADAPIAPTAIADVMDRAGVPTAHRAVLAECIARLWTCFTEERLLLAEINPLFMTPDGRCIAGDAKVIVDDDILRPQERRFLSLGGDIAIIASGGGASLLNVDALMAHGGRPANYAEYSGNPSADVVRDLTIRVLAQEGLRGCWVIGGTANFTDILGTMQGFLDGLRRILPRPTYPIVVRRDGPRKTEAFAMLQDAAAHEGYQMYTFDSATPMEESARIMCKLAYQ